MIEVSGTVIDRLSDGRVWVETRRSSGCSGCQAKSGCGQGLLNDYADQRSKDYILATSDVALAKGDRVFVSVSESFLVMASLWIYFVPLALLMAGVFLSAVLNLNDLAAILVCGASLTVSYCLLKKLSGKISDASQVRVTKVLVHSVS